MHISNSEADKRSRRSRRDRTRRAENEDEMGREARHVGPRSATARPNVTAAALLTRFGCAEHLGTLGRIRKAHASGGQGLLANWSSPHRLHLTHF